MRRRPCIGLTCDHERRPNRGVEVAHSVLSGWYSDAVVAAGGLPLLLPTASAASLDYVEHIQGLVLTGGDLDIDPAKYGEEPHEKLGKIIAERTDFELALLAEAERRGMPVLGVCGGMQLMNVHRGGALFQDLPAQRPGPIAHTQLHDKRDPAHLVNVHAGGLLARIVGAGELLVNSTHHQAIKTLGQALVSEAVSEDGICEAIADPSGSFYLGIQWHPEAMVNDVRQQAIYRALVDAARG